MKGLAAAKAVFLVVCGAFGLPAVLQPLSIDHASTPIDLTITDTASSPYQSIQWTQSSLTHTEDMRFSERYIQGSLLRKPSWADLVKHDPTHPMASGGQDAVAGSGPVNWTQYFTVLPAAPLWVSRGKQDEPLDILMLGLGSGVGITSLSYHFPQACITAVDVDGSVKDMALANYPLLASLRDSMTDRGEPRLRLDNSTVSDARQFVRRALRTGKRYDIVVLDVYAGSGFIPAHLATREFYKQVSGLLTERGIIAANFIGSLTGELSGRLGGMMRAIQESGLPHGHLFPVFYPPFSGTFLPDRKQNFLYIGYRGERFDLSQLRSFRHFPLLEHSAPTVEMLGFMNEQGRPISQYLPVQHGDRRWDQMVATVKKGSRRVSFFPESSILINGDVQTIQTTNALAHELFGPGYLAGARPYHFKGIAIVRYDPIAALQHGWQLTLNEAMKEVSPRVFYFDADHLRGTGDAPGILPPQPEFTDARMNADIVGR